MVRIEDAPARGRHRVNKGTGEVRDRLIESALVQFAAHGFEGASTRAIATGAQAHQPQINYHFESKDGLWRACLERLLGELEAAVREEAGGTDRNDVRAMFVAIVRGMVLFASRRPELNRIMMHEGTAPSPRLDWLVGNHLGWRFNDLRTRWEQLQQSGDAVGLPPSVLYHVLTGASALLYANAPEAILLGVDPSDPAVVDAHADALVAMLLPPRPSTRT